MFLTAIAGMTIGNAVTGGTDNAMLYIDGSGNLASAAFTSVATSGNLLTLTAQADTDTPLAVAGHSQFQSTPLQRWYYNGTIAASMNQFGQLTLGCVGHAEQLSTNHGLEVYGSLAMIPGGASGSTDIEVWKDATASAAISFGNAVPGTAVTDDLIFSLYGGGGGASWREALRVKNDGTGTCVVGGGVVVGNATLATTATDGFLYFPTCVGAPTGTPTSRTGTLASIYDTTDNKLYVYNGAWKSVTLT